MKRVLKDKKDEITKSKKLLRRAKEDAIKEYRDSDALLSKLGGFYADGFNDCLHQVKASDPDLNLSHVSIDAEGQTPACPVELEGTENLFADADNPVLQVNEEATHVGHEKFVDDGNHQPKDVQVVKKKNEETPPFQQ